MGNEVVTDAPVQEEEETHAEQEARAVEEALEEAGITSEYRVSLAWESKADLELDIDQTAGQEGQHVENVSFDGDVAAEYVVYVTNYASKGDQGEIPFTVFTKQGQHMDTFEESWDIDDMGTETQDNLNNMMQITTVHVAGVAHG